MNTRETYKAPVLDRNENLKEMTRIDGVISNPGTTPAEVSWPTWPNCWRYKGK